MLPEAWEQRATMLSLTYAYVWKAAVGRAGDWEQRHNELTSGGPPTGWSSPVHRKFSISIKSAFFDGLMPEKMTVFPSGETLRP